MTDPDFALYYLSHVMNKPALAIREQQRRSSACVPLGLRRMNQSVWCSPHFVGFVIRRLSFIYCVNMVYDRLFDKYHFHMIWLNLLKSPYAFVASTAKEPET